MNSGSTSGLSSGNSIAAPSEVSLDDLRAGSNAMQQHGIPNTDILLKIDAIKVQISRCESELLCYRDTCENLYQINSQASRLLREMRHKHFRHHRKPIWRRVWEFCTCSSELKSLNFAN